LFRQLLRIAQSSGISIKYAAHFIADSSETLQYLGFPAGGFRRIVERPMVAVQLTRENRAGLIRIAADGDNGVNRLLQKFRERLGAMRGNINPYLGHDFDGEWMNVASGFRASALDVRSVAQCGAQKTFADVAAAGIAGAENEDGGFHFEIRRSI
jgi:hypothetical protein